MQENPKVMGQREADAQGEQFLERYGHGAQLRTRSMNGI